MPLQWLGLNLLAGLAFGALFYAIGSGTAVPQAFGLGVLVALLVLLAVVPWLALKSGWLWWLGSAVGVIVGFVGAGLLLISLLKVETFCVIGSCPPPNPYIDAGFGAITLAVMGVGQAITLRGSARKLRWLVTATVAAVVFPYGFVLSAPLTGHSASNPGLLAALLAGAAWGIVEGIGVTSLIKPSRWPAP